MNFTQYTLKNGKTYTGYPTDTVGSQINLLCLKDDNVVFGSFSKSALQETNVIREATALEKDFVENYILFSKEAGELEGQIRQLKHAKETAEENREKQLVGLYELASKSLREGTGILTIGRFEDSLTESGYKNLFILQRHGILVLGQNEEVLYQEVSGKLVALIEKQAHEVAGLLNQTPLNREVANVVLGKLSKEAIHETIKHEHKQKLDKEEQTKKETLNLSDIKDKLNEHGFKTLKEFQEKKLLTISDDGTMVFKNPLNLPFLNDVLKNEKLLVDVLNQPTPVVPVGFPFNELLKDLEKQFRHFLK